MDAKRAARIEALLSVPGWDDLTSEIEEAEERYWRNHRARLTSGEPVDQREIDFMRGKFDAAKQLLKQPVRAQRILAKDAEKEETTDE